MPKGLKGFQKGHKINVGKKRPNWLYKPHLGMKHTEETIRKIKEKRAKQIITKKTGDKISAGNSGSKHWNWQGGKTSQAHTIRRSREYKLWRKAVFERDNYTCIWCGKRGGKLNADHIKPFCDYPELRFAIDNGRTLCLDCHKKTITYGWIWANRNKTRSVS